MNYVQNTIAEFLNRNGWNMGNIAAIAITIEGSNENLHKEDIIEDINAVLNTKGILVEFNRQQILEMKKNFTSGRLTAAVMLTECIA